MPLLFVMLGGALGSGARYLVSRWLGALLGVGFPWGTLAVNIAGGLCMGLLAGTLARIGGSETVRLFVAVGVLGGFTTFSSFSLDAITLFQRGATMAAAGYVAVSLVGALAALVAGLAIARSWP